MAWYPVSHGVSPKGVFDFLGFAKMASMFLGVAKITSYSVV